MLITGGLLRKTRRPGTAASFWVSERATSSAPNGRSPRGLRWMKQPALVGRVPTAAAPHRRHEALDVGVLLHDRRGCPLVLHHVVEAGAFRRLGRAEQLSLVLTRDESLGDDPARGAPCR